MHATAHKPTGSHSGESAGAELSKQLARHPFSVIRRAYDHFGIRQVCVGMSCGKDATATLTLCVETFGAANIFPYFMYVVPNLSFQERYLSYIERLLGVTIKRLPHWVLSQLYRGKVFRHPTKQSANVPRVTIRDIENHVRKLSGFEWMASGEKAIDSLERNAQLRSVAGANLKRRKFWPLAFWNHDSVFNFLKQRGIALPADYSNPLAQRSSGGLWYREIAWVRATYPDDWRKMCEQFPLLPAQIMRYEMRAKKSRAANVEHADG